MKTINISIPDKLKQQADRLVEAGYYASFSDVVRDSLRSIIESNTYDLMAEEAKREIANGEGSVLKTAQDVDDYFKKLKQHVQPTHNGKVR
jgi:putative addiction module CopG family antidote